MEYRIKKAIILIAVDIAGKESFHSVKRSARNLTEFVCRNALKVADKRKSKIYNEIYKLCSIHDTQSLKEYIINILISE